MPQDRQNHWQRTRSLTLITLVVWFFFAFFVHWFGAELNSVSFIGFPLGFYLAAQGSPLAFVLILLFSTRRQEAIDAECGFDQEEDA
ncbi:MAG: sodium/substrate symporter small subunit [Pseudomonadota bacterium]